VDRKDRSIVAVVLLGHATVHVYEFSTNQAIPGGAVTVR
jgi:hypothetical protein